MCEAVTIMLGVSAAIGAASSAMQYKAQSEAAAQQQGQYLQNQVNAQQAYLNDLALMDIRQGQEDDAKMKASFDAKRDTLRAKGQVLASAGTTQGVSVGELLSDFDRNEAERENDLLYNRNAGALQGAFDRSGMEITKQSRINSVSRGQQPSALGALMTFAGGTMVPAVTQYGKYANWKGFDRIS